MLVIKSSITGQTLFGVELRNADVFLSPIQARELIALLGGSPIGYHIDVSQTGSGMPVPAGCMMGVHAVCHPDVSFGVGQPHARNADQATNTKGT